MLTLLKKIMLIYYHSAKKPNVDDEVNKKDDPIHLENMQSYRVNLPRVEFTCGLCLKIFPTQEVLRLHSVACSEHNLNNDHNYRASILYQTFSIFRTESMDFILRWIHSSFEFRHQLVRSIVGSYTDQVTAQLQEHFQNATIVNSPMKKVQSEKEHVDVERGKLNLPTNCNWICDCEMKKLDFI